MRRKKLKPSEYKLKLLKDLGHTKVNESAKQTHRRAIWECPICFKPFEACPSNIKSGGTTKCANCTKTLKNKQSEKEVELNGLIARTKFKQSKEGMLSLIYSSQKARSKKRNFPKPSYTLEEFKTFAYMQPNFNLLYNNWVKSDYHIDLKPSFDRKDSLLPYTLSNLKLMTWLENNTKGRIEKNKSDGLLSVILSNPKVLNLVQKEFKNDLRIQLLLQKGGEK